MEFHDCFSGECFEKYKINVILKITKMKKGQNHDFGPFYSNHHDCGIIGGPFYFDNHFRNNII